MRNNILPAREHIFQIEIDYDRPLLQLIEVCQFSKVHPVIDEQHFPHINSGVKRMEVVAFCFATESMPTDAVYGVFSKKRLTPSDIYSLLALAEFSRSHSHELFRNPDLLIAAFGQSLRGPCQGNFFPFISSQRTGFRYLGLCRLNPEDKLVQGSIWFAGVREKA